MGGIEKITVSNKGVNIGKKLYSTLGETHIGHLRYYDYNTYSNCAVIEQIKQGTHQFICHINNNTKIFPAYTHDSLNPSHQTSSLYLGFSANEVLDSGRDILAEEVLKLGEPDYKTVSTILPPLGQNAYCFLGGEASQSSVCIDQAGQIFPQHPGATQPQNPMFAPSMVDANLSGLKAHQYFLGGYLPILFSVHSDGEQALEFIYFVEHGDPDRDPLVWIRSAKYKFANKDEAEITYRIASASPARTLARMMPESTFWDAFVATVAFWSDYAGKTTQLTLPEPQLSHTVNGAMISLATTFTGAHAHYGHKHYGHEANDNFLPSYIWAIEANCILGHGFQARKNIEHLLSHSFDYKGRLFYRQGAKEIRAASAAEYGQLLFTIDRFSLLIKTHEWIEPYIQTIIKMGYYLLENRVECPELGNKRLIKMCAEADTSARVHVYTNNNLWAVRGLQALSRITLQYDQTASTRFGLEAESLQNDIHAALQEHQINTVYGPLVPFRFGYTATPLNLSTCHRFYTKLTEQERKEYFVPSFMRGQSKEGADITENTYANYRYYLEMLSSGLLSDSQMRAIQNMREDLGGELLGMTRLYRWLDDWPVANYARYILSTDQVEKYLLLLYAHTAHHGHPDLMCYYEQINIEGTVLANDCVPSLLTTPLMTAWMFAFEPIGEDAVYLLRAIPKKWFETGFTVDNIYTGKGNFSIYVAAEHEGICISLTATNCVEETPVYLFLRCFEAICEADIVTGMEHIKAVNGNKLELYTKADTLSVKVLVKM